LLPFRHNPFEIMLNSQPEQTFAVLLNVIAKKGFPPVRHNGTQPGLAVDQGQVPEVFAIVPEQVESVEPRLATAEQPLRGSFGGLGNGNGTSGEVILFEQTAKSHLTSMMKQD
jgi:hypothetical protein